MSLWEAVQYLDEIVDNSDPDTEDNQTIHLVQTGESLRKLYPGDEYDWVKNKKKISFFRKRKLTFPKHTTFPKNSYT